MRNSGIIILAVAGLISMSFWLTSAVLSKGLESLPGYTLIWKVQSIDTMKHSRDPAHDVLAKAQIPAWVDMVSQLDPTHIGVATPYDDEFIPYMKVWVSEARSRNMKVWFRGNFSGWENWFGYADLASAEEHHILLERFIVNNADLFENGDIFTPAPEAENGLLGDPRFQNKQEFLEFLKKSYETCVRAMGIIGKEVSCGYFSMNGDVVREVLSEEVIANTGGIVVPDHYVNTLEKFEKDVEGFYDLYRVPIVMGEFGAPIPDLQGDLTEDEQKEFVRNLLQILYFKRDKVIGLNYWVFMGGSTRLFNDDRTPRAVIEVVKDYFKPGNITGIIKNSAGGIISNATITLSNGLPPVSVDSEGKFVIPVPAGESVRVQVSAEGYQTGYESIQGLKRGEIVELRMSLDPETQSYLYLLRKELYELKLKMIQTMLNVDRG